MPGHLTAFIKIETFSWHMAQTFDGLPMSSVKKQRFLTRETEISSKTQKLPHKNSQEDATRLNNTKHIVHIYDKIYTS